MSCLRTLADILSRQARTSLSSDDAWIETLFGDSDSHPAAAFSRLDLRNAGPRAGSSQLSGVDSDERCWFQELDAATKEVADE